ncbi:MAG: glycosyltransferase family 1 protein [Candidatus Shapirobacteria bacterium]
MRIAFDISPLESGHKIRGIGFYTRNLAHELKKLIKKTDWSFNEVNSHIGSKRSSLYDLIHYPYFDLFFLSLPLFKSTKLVVTIHDVIPLLYPKYYPPGAKGRIRFQIQKFLLKRIDAVVTDTKASKKDIVKYLGYPKEKIYPIYLGTDKKFQKIPNLKRYNQLRRKYNLPSKFVLYVGDVNYNKNLVRLARACKTIDTTLAIVGKQAVIEEFDKKHPEMKMWTEFLHKYKSDPDIKRLGFVKDEELVGLYNCASIYCQPSLHEGFGLPVLEAMSCGCPVVCAKTPALEEIAGDAALYANPYSSRNIASKLSLVLEESKTKNTLIAKGYSNIKRFSWEKCARETLDVYRKVLNL